MWQRFTERARRVILLGQEAAREMDSPDVGTEHLLLGLVQENEGAAAQVLLKLGLSAEQLRQEVEANASVPNPSMGREPKLTLRGKRVLELAADESRRMRHNYIGTEHLLLALLREKDGIAAKVLRKLGLDLVKARNQVMEYLGPETPAETEKVVRDMGGHITTRTYNDFTVTPEVQILLRAALVSAYQRNQTAVDVADLLLIILQTAEWAEVLGSAGLDPKAILARLEGHLKADAAS